MKKLLISIKPKWTAKILNGEKTIEVRRTAPKCELPCEVYIYCTKGKPYIALNKRQTEMECRNELNCFDNPFVKKENAINGKVVAKFTLNKIVPIVMQHGGLGDMWYGYCAHEDFKWYYEIEDQTRVSYDELKKYFKGKDGYAWHIDNLVIFDKPKELGDFIKFGTPTYEQTKPFAEAFGEPYSKEEYRKQCERFGYMLKRAPQSWCYCEVEE